MHGLRRLAPAAREGHAGTADALQVQVLKDQAGAVAGERHQVVGPAFAVEDKALHPEPRHVRQADEPAARRLLGAVPGDRLVGGGGLEAHVAGDLAAVDFEGLFDDRIDNLDAVAGAGSRQGLADRRQAPGHVGADLPDVRTAHPSTVGGAGGPCVKGPQQKGNEGEKDGGDHGGDDPAARQPAEEVGGIQALERPGGPRLPLRGTPMGGDVEPLPGLAVLLRRKGRGG